MNWEKDSSRIYPIRPLIDVRLLEASEFVDSETDQKYIVIERGQYDNEKRKYEEFKSLGLPVFDMRYDQDMIRYFIPAGTETMKSYMPKVIESINSELESTNRSEIYVPFYELGKLLGKMSSYRIGFSNYSVLEKIAITPDLSGRFGLQNFLIPPLDFKFQSKQYIDIDRTLAEIRGYHLKKEDHNYLVESLMTGFVEYTWEN